MEDERLSRLKEPHVAPLMGLIRKMRAHGLEVPNVDPNDRGVGARVLFLLESPSPKAVASSFVSCDNPDPSDKNMRTELEAAELTRQAVLLWNVVPQAISTAVQNRNASSADIIAAIPDTQAFIDCLPNLKAIVFCGGKAKAAFRHLHLPVGVQAFFTAHTGAQAYNHARHREAIQQTFRAAATAAQT